MNKKIDSLITAYISEDKEVISNLANLSAILYHNLENINWLGFYLANNQQEELILGPFQGYQAISNIKFSAGVCGECARKKTTIIVPDVHCCEGHIACDIRSKSEIVIPIFQKDGSLYGVLDVDAPIKNRFTKVEQELLENIVQKLEELL
ncbi:MAG: GAF domain-containing protein [Mycoplasmatales bacterium]